MEKIENYRDWANLPFELLEQIIDLLPLIELLAFRGVCKSWRLTSTQHPPKDQSKSRGLWILFYSSINSPKCFLYDESSRRYYTIYVPELHNSSCIASDYGWLLMKREDYLFFLHPFSQMRVELPKIHDSSSATGHMAAFTAPPTSKGCRVFLVSWNDLKTVELNTCCRGATEWTKSSWPDRRRELGPIVGAIYAEGALYYFDSNVGVGTFHVEKEEFGIYKLVERTKTGLYLPFHIWRTRFEDKIASELCLSHDGSKLKDLLTNFDEKKLHISVCGTKVPYRGREACIAHEDMDYSMEGADDKDEPQHIEAVWIAPLFVEPSAKCRWSS